MSLDTTKADDIALVIEEAIVSGELEPGTVLRQEQLSEQFNVSRTPIREALRRLAALGLVSFVPNRGVRVRTISREELHEAFMVRAELEALATEVAADEDDGRGSHGARGGRAALRQDLQGPPRPRAGRGAPLDHGRLGAREPRLPRRHLPRRRPAARRAAREERAPLLLRAGRVGARATTRSTASTRRTPSSTARSGRRSPPAAARERGRSRATTSSPRSSCSRRSSSRSAAPGRGRSARAAKVRS